MRSFLILVRVQALALAHSLRPQGSRSWHGAARCLVALAYIALSAVIALYLALLGVALMSFGIADAIPAFAVAMGALGGAAFTFLKANGTLFGLNDFDLVMALPVPHRTVVAARSATLYVSAALTGALFALPLWAVYLLLVNPTPWAVLCCAVSLALAPAIPTALAVFLAFGISAAASRFRHANIAFVILSLAGLSVLLVAIYGFSFTANANGGEAMIAQIGGGLGAVREAIFSAWPPAGWVARACEDASPAALGAFIAASLAVPAIALEIVQRGYLSINAALTSGLRGRALSGEELRHRSARTATPFIALLRKEYRTLLGIPAYAFNCLFGYLLMIGIAVAASIIGLDALLASGAIEGVTLDTETYRAYAGIVANVLAWVFAFCAITSPSAACSLSIEGRSAWVCATAPVPARTILRAKLASNALPVAGALCASAVILLACSQVDPVGALQIVLTGFGAFYLMVNIGMAIDVRQPNYSWVSPNEVVKRGLPITVTVIGGMGLAFAGGAATVGLSLSVGALAGTLSNLAVGIAGIGAGELLFRHTCVGAHLYLS